METEEHNDIQSVSNKRGGWTYGSTSDEGLYDNGNKDLCTCNGKGHGFHFSSSYRTLLYIVHEE